MYLQKVGLSLFTEQYSKHLNWNITNMHGMCWIGQTHISYWHPPMQSPVYVLFFHLSNYLNCPATDAIRVFVFIPKFWQLLSCIDGKGLKLTMIQTFCLESDIVRVYVNSFRRWIVFDPIFIRKKWYDSRLHYWACTIFVGLYTVIWSKWRSLTWSHTLSFIYAVDWPLRAFILIIKTFYFSAYTCMCLGSELIMKWFHLYV